MTVVLKQRGSQLQGRMSETYDLFLRLFMVKFLRASEIWWTPFVKARGKDEGRSLADLVKEDPRKAIKKLTRGRLRRLEALALAKFESALIMWAIEKMGEDIEKYMSPGLEDFFSSVCLQMGWPRDFLTAVHISPLSFPLQRQKRSAFPRKHIYKLKDEYETLLAIVKGIKTQTRRSPGAQKCALLANLPGTSVEKVECYQGMKPSAIVWDFLARKYCMPLSGEGLKKQFPNRIPQDLFDQEMRQLKKRKTN